MSDKQTFFGFVDEFYAERGRVKPLDLENADKLTDDDLLSVGKRICESMKPAIDNVERAGRLVEAETIEYMRSNCLRLCKEAADNDTRLNYSEFYDYQSKAMLTATLPLVASGVMTPAEGLKHASSLTKKLRLLEE